MADPATIQKRAEERAERKSKNAAARKRTRQRLRDKRAAARAETPAQAPLEGKQHGPGKPKERQGVVVSDKGDKTITVRIDITRRHHLQEDRPPVHDAARARREERRP